MTDSRTERPVRVEPAHTDVIAAATVSEATPVEGGPDDRAVGSRRRKAARGTLINSGFDVAWSGLALLQRIAIAAFLTRAEFGLLGIIGAILLTLSWLKDFGIGDKYLQQSEPDQELAFQKAFTLELYTSIGFFAFVAAVLPLWALAYGHESIIAPGIVACLAVPISAFEMPAWIPYRRMDYGRQRRLTAIDPITMFAVTVGVAAAGGGIWCFPAGIVMGSLAGGIVCTITSPYPLRLRIDRQTVREYARFSWPLVGAGLSGLLVIQGSLLVATHVVGVAGVGSIALATSFAVLADRVDGIVSKTIYPAVCAVVDRRDLLAEVFTKSNRVALMWALPVGAGLALFAGDLVHYVLGDKWRPAVGLLTAFALTCAFGQVAFNWAVFMRALNNTRPLFVSSVVNIAVFLSVSVPAMFALGVTGYAIGFAAANTVQVAIRGYYMGRLFRGFSVLRQLARAALPTLPPTALIVALHLLAPGGRTLSRAIAEIVAFSLGVVLLTWLFERDLVSEIIGYFRRKRTPHPVAT